MVELLDVAPTICDYAGVPVPPQFQGRSLRRFTSATPTPASSEEQAIACAPPGFASIRNPDYRLIVDQAVAAGHALPRGKLTKTGLFRVADDPWCTRSVEMEPEMKSVLADLRARLQARVGRQASGK